MVRNIRDILWCIRKIFAVSFRQCFGVKLCYKADSSKFFGLFPTIRTWNWLHWFSSSVGDFSWVHHRASQVKHLLSFFGKYLTPNLVKVDFHFLFLIFFLKLTDFLKIRKCNFTRVPTIISGEHPGPWKIFFRGNVNVVSPRILKNFSDFLFLHVIDYLLFRPSYCPLSFIEAL